MSKHNFREFREAMPAAVNYAFAISVAISVMPTAAHLKVDPVTGEMMFFGYSPFTLMAGS